MSDELHQTFDALKELLGKKMSNTASDQRARIDAMNAVMVGAGWDTVEAKPASVGGTTLYFYKGEGGDKDVVYALTLRGTPRQTMQIAEALAGLHIAAALKEVELALAEVETHLRADPPSPSVTEEARRSAFAAGQRMNEILNEGLRIDGVTRL
jgi:hypothetical protein